jgi:hypothetical protein
MKTVKFMVDERPFACSDWKLREKNLEFLRGVDPCYFQYAALSHVSSLDGDNRQYASLAIRIAYSQGMESLFAFLAAAAQAPECVVGWLLAYRNVDLKSVVRKISTSTLTHSRLKQTAFDWEYLSTVVHSYLGYDKAKTEWIQSGFGRLWSRLAREFVDEKFSLEYNSLKHALRPRPGGAIVTVGAEPAPGVAPPPEEMKNIGGSEFGTSYFIIEKIGDGRLNFRPKRQAQNWIPQNLVNGLLLIAMSIRNVVSFLRILNGEPPADCRFENPDLREAFISPWALSPGVLSISIDTAIRPEDVRLCSKEDVVASYESAS